MADILLASQEVPSTPGAGNCIWWFDSVAGVPFLVDENGRAWGKSFNAAIASQGPGFTSDTYVTNSGIVIPSFGVQAKTNFIWRISASKNSTGVAAPVYSIRIGSNQSTADTARLQLTGPAQTVATDIGILTIMATVRSVGASGVIQGSAGWMHNGAAAGVANNDAGVVEGTGSGFDNSNLSGQYIGLSINAGSSANWTLTQVIAEATW